MKNVTNSFSEANQPISRTDKAIRNSIFLFSLCLLVHIFEVMVIRTDETVFAECFINKLFGIVLLFIVLRCLRRTWGDIGFTKTDAVSNIGKGMLLCAVFYTIAFAAEFLILFIQGNAGHLEFFVTGFSLMGNVVKRTGAGFVLLCIFFNIINAWMEEGLFRGFFLTYIARQHTQKTALYLSAFLFGLWHLVTPLRSVLDNEMSVWVFAVMSIGYIILSAMMGIKWGVLFQLSGTVWIGAADHFFNNCVATNLLHVVTKSGIDELLIVRVLIGELTSFAAVMIYAKHKKRMLCKSLEEVRENIDRIDDAIIRLIAERTTYVVQASFYKKDEEGVKDTKRVEKVIEKVRKKAGAYGADADMVEELYRNMISRFVSMEMEEFEDRK